MLREVWLENLFKNHLSVYHKALELILTHSTHDQPHDWLSQYSRATTRLISPLVYSQSKPCDNFADLSAATQLRYVVSHAPYLTVSGASGLSLHRRQWTVKCAYLTENLATKTQLTTRVLHILTKE